MDRVSVSEKNQRVFSLTGTSGKRVLYIGFIDQFWRKIILHLIKTGIFRIKFPLTRDSWLNPSRVKDGHSLSGSMYYTDLAEYL